jgi:tRNA (5-methylaminomethyl-2-thiouridylate)-methyltransferase (EC 2.1.1.61)
VGELNKTEVRKVAETIGLHNARKKDSTGICFIGERPFRDFLSRYLPTQPGAMKTPEGKTVGQHLGLAFYTLGQRKGIGLGGSKSGNGEPWFVAGKDLERNQLIVAQGHDHPLLLSHTLQALSASWVSGAAPAEGACGYGAKTRYRQVDAACRYQGTGTERFTLKFDSPQWAVTPGQSAVLYDGEVCLGGGIIEAASRND